MDSDYTGNCTPVLPVLQSLPVIVLLPSDSTHEMSAEAAEAGENQGLLTDGRRIHQEPRTTQATGRETGGQ